METLSHKVPDRSGDGFIRIKRDTWRLLRREAFDREMSMGQLIDQLLRAELAKQAAKRSA